MKCSLAFFTKRSLCFFKALKNGQKTRSLFLGSGCWSSKFSRIINSDVSILPNIQMIFLSSVLSFNIAGKNIYIFKLLCNNFPINLSIHIFAILARDVISNFGKLFWISISRKIFYLLTSLARRRPPFFSTIIRPSVTKFLPISSLFEASETVTNSRVPILYSVLILTCRSRTSSLRALSPEAAYSSCFYEKKKKWKKCLFCMYSFFRENYSFIIGTKRSYSP